MSTLTTNYLGLQLKNPIIAASSGLTNSLSNIIELEANGAAAVVVKSIFEEEIRLEAEDNFNKMTSQGFIYPETMEYFDYDEMGDPVFDYLKLISDAKAKVKIPIIASVNCVSAEKWTDFAKRIQDAGADAIELNLFVLPTDLDRSSDENERIYFEVIEKVLKVVTIPVAIKISPYHSSLASFIQRLSRTGISGIVLFNRFYNTDFDIHSLEFTSTNVFSTPSEIALSLRWVALMADRVDCDLAASTGVHDGDGAIKQLLAGANAVQVCSALYRNGFGHISLMLRQMEQWMKDNGYNSIADFKGKMSQSRTYNPAAFERVQFMKYFRERE
ncbi:MAG: dihydroorotate dehydrogenase-like protein [Tenuifilaceae bacterium]|jgi:dihydroorotate dehydrogenase (fumarate)|nr:dihydroorotate dehydrogenase-like protein [Tenuifilaceae bacterium]